MIGFQTWIRRCEIWHLLRCSLAFRNFLKSYSHYLKVILSTKALIPNLVFPRKVWHYLLNAILAVSVDNEQEPGKRNAMWYVILRHYSNARNVSKNVNASAFFNEVKYSSYIISKVVRVGLWGETVAYNLNVANGQKQRSAWAKTQS